MTNHNMFCKHRPNDECTHYQEGITKHIYYLKFKDQNWYYWNNSKQWEQVEDWFVEFFINNPISIDKTIKKERKYKWSNVPENIKWIATSEEGFAFGYESKPISGYLHYGFWYGGGQSKLILWADENQFNSSNWRYSLEGRD